MWRLRCGGLQSQTWKQVEEKHHHLWVNSIIILYMLRYSNAPPRMVINSVQSYSVGRYTSDLPVNTVDALITSALDVWAKASPLTFLRSYSHQADIMVEFVGNGKFESTSVRFNL